MAMPSPSTSKSSRSHEHKSGSDGNDDLTVQIPSKTKGNRQWQHRVNDILYRDPPKPPFHTNDKGDINKNIRHTVSLPVAKERSKDAALHRRQGYHRRCTIEVLSPSSKYDMKKPLTVDSSLSSSAPSPNTAKLSSLSKELSKVAESRRCNRRSSGEKESTRENERRPKPLSRRGRRNAMEDQMNALRETMLKDELPQEGITRPHIEVPSTSGNKTISLGQVKSNLSQDHEAPKDNRPESSSSDKGTSACPTLQDIMNNLPTDTKDQSHHNTLPSFLLKREANKKNLYKSLDQKLISKDCPALISTRNISDQSDKRQDSKSKQHNQPLFDSTLDCSFGFLGSSIYLSDGRSSSRGLMGSLGEINYDSE